MNNKLSIAIPTYNRPEILIEGLDRVLADLIKFQIPIYISDDSSNDLTKIAVESFKSNRYPHIFYNQNVPSLGHDMNCIRTIKMANTEYVWYLGDSIIIHDDTLEIILNTIKDEAPDLIAIYSDRIFDMPLISRRVENTNELLKSIGWHLTMTGVTIYRREVVDAVEISVDRFKNFPQLALILEIMLQIDGSSLSWINQRLVRSNPKKVSYWNNSIFTVFIEDLDNTLKNLSKSVHLDLRNGVLREHAKQTGLFSLKNLLALRSKGYFTKNEYLKFGARIAKYGRHPRMFIFFISIFPITILERLRKCFF